MIFLETFQHFKGGVQTSLNGKTGIKNMRKKGKSPQSNPNPRVI